MTANEVLKKIAAHLERESWNSIKNNASDYEELLREAGLGELIAAGEAMNNDGSSYEAKRAWDAALSRIGL